MAEEKNKTELGIDENIEGLLCYILGWITGLVFLLVEKDNKFVKFHAVQSIALSIAAFVITVALMILSFMPYLGPVFGILNGFITLGLLALWIAAMIKAAQGEKYKLPVVGDTAEKYSL